MKAQKLGELQEEVRIAKEKKRERAIEREREQGQIEEALALVNALSERIVPKHLLFLPKRKSKHVGGWSPSSC